MSVAEVARERISAQLFKDSFMQTNHWQKTPSRIGAALRGGNPFRKVATTFALSPFLLAACSGVASEDEHHGTVELALQTSSQGTTYELRDARFRIEGPESVELSGENAPEEAAIEHELPAGQYTVELLDGWRLFRTDGDQELLLDAKLSTVNPAAFSIVPDSLTQVAYRFAVEGSEVSFEAGSLALSFEVDVHQPLKVFFTEIMKNPEGIPDSSGEYLELSNAGTADVSLTGCLVTRDTQSFEITKPLSIPAGGAVVLANSDSPGFVPDYVYSSVSLPNTTSFNLKLSCDGKEIDSVPFGATTFPNAAGKSASLSKTAWTAAANDLSGVWCDAVEPYGVDLGTPGKINAPCK